MKNKFHSEILKSIIAVSKTGQADKEGFVLKYLGTNKASYHLDTGTVIKIAKNFIKENTLSQKEFEGFIDSLYSGKSCEEIFIAAKIVGLSHDHRQKLGLSHLDKWLGNVCGWAETDSLCQMAFTGDDLLTRWPEWSKLITQFSIDKNIHKRRASLVLLTKPLRQSEDPRLCTLAIHNLDLLKNEKDILITKAVSWILRSMIKNHRGIVTRYLEENRNQLPRIAVREVTTKLKTGKKYINNKKSKQQ